MIRCEGHSGLCIDLIDSDADPDCFVEVGNMRRMDKTLVLCPACRDHREEQMNREPPDREFSPTQQAIINAAEAAHSDEDPTP